MNRQIRYPKRRLRKRRVNNRPRILFVIGLSLFFIYLFFFTKPGLLQVFRYYKENKTLDKQIAYERAKQDSLNQEIAIFKCDTSDLKDYLKTRFNYIGSGEVIYKIENGE